MNKTKFSIVIASYNYSKYIEKAIKSVLSQNYYNWELVIVDDGSSDNSVEIIEKYSNQDQRIKLYTHLNNKNLGLAETLKLAIEKCKGDYIVFLESDDYIRDDYLSLKLEVINTYPKVGFIYNDIEIIYEGTPDNEYIDYLKELNEYWNKHNYPHKIVDIMHYKNCIPTFSCVTLKKELIIDCDFNPPNKAWLDYWLWTQICGKTDFYFIQEKLTYWIKHDNSYMSRRQKRRIDILLFFVKLYKIMPKCSNWKKEFLFRIFAVKNILYYLFLIVYLYLKDAYINSREN